MEKQILIAVDGSVASSFALEYVAFFFAHRPEVHFQLLHCASCSGSILPEPEDRDKSLIPDKKLSKSQKHSDLHLTKAKLKLTNLGIEETRITIATRQSSSNIAQAIQLHAEKQLVDSIVIARRGVGIVGEMLLGSVSSELFRKCHAIPLWVIDGAVISDRILVPVDGTPPSLMAIDHLAHIFAERNDVHFYLFHARKFLSSAPACRPQDFYDKWGQEWCDVHLSGNGCMFTGPTQLLTNAGIPKEMITTLPEPASLEESTAIISSAKKHKCGTIVIGRRNQRESKNLFGGVSSRTILQTEDMALWVIG